MGTPPWSHLKKKKKKKSGNQYKAVVIKLNCYFKLLLRILTIILIIENHNDQLVLSFFFT